MYLFNFSFKKMHFLQKILEQSNERVYKEPILITPIMNHGTLQMENWGQDRPKDSMWDLMVLIAIVCVIFWLSRG